MIRYRTDLIGLQNSIDQEKPTWRTRAATATTASAIWTEIKWVYLELQRRKCAFCERRPSSWAGDYAVEHFRPKSLVKDWPSANHTRYSDFSFAASGSNGPGYHLLIYHPLNYAAACTQCNTRLKANYFPVAGPRDYADPDPISLTVSERPYLIYPLGNHDVDPEDLIGFDGIVPIAKAAVGSHDFQRAEVTIEIFWLERREELRRERARVIDSLIDDLNDENSHPDSERRRKARAAIRRAQSRGSEHSSCAKCFVNLYRRDPVRARQLAASATTYLKRSILRGLPRI